MPLYEEPFYCHEQIDVPVDLPDIIKQFTKAAIRTQPTDLLQWCGAYFTALANGEMPPVKQRYEIPIATQKVDTGLTPNIIRALNTQDIATSMKSICEQFTMDPEGGANSMDFKIWCKLYRFLAKLDGDIPCACIERVIDYLSYEAVKQNGMIMPRNFMHKDCPPLHPTQSKTFPPA